MLGSQNFWGSTFWEVLPHPATILPENGCHIISQTFHSQDAVIQEIIWDLRNRVAEITPIIASISPKISSASDSMVGDQTVTWPRILVRLPADSTILTTLESREMLREEISVLTIGILSLSRIRCCAAYAVTVCWFSSQAGKQSH